MTRDEILAIPAGDEMNILIATRVFTESEGKISRYGSDWNFSVDISAAWCVVEKLKETWEIVDIWHQRNVGHDWFCEVVGNGTGEFANEITAPLAICRAALLATLED